MQAYVVNVINTADKSIKHHVLRRYNDFVALDKSVSAWTMASGTAVRLAADAAFRLHTAPS